MYLIAILNNISVFAYKDYQQWCLKWGNEHWYPLSCDWTIYDDSEVWGFEIELPMKDLKPLCQKLELLRSSGRLLYEIESGLDYEESLAK